MGFTHAAFSVGAVAGPLAAGAVMAGGLPWQTVYRILAGVSLYGIDAARAAVLVSLFWGGLLAGRLLIPLAARRLPLAIQLIGLCLVNAGMVVFVALARTPMMLAVAVLLAGVGASSIYPLTVTIVGKQLKDQQSVGIGVMSTLGGIGSFSFPCVMALIAERSDLRAGFVFIAAMGGLLVLLGFGIRLRLRQTAR